jgi:hypothetical protein
MAFLVDTNVLSELMRPKPDRNVVGWLELHESDLFVSAVSIGEIRFGIVRLPKGKRRQRFEKWFEELCRIFQDKVLAYDGAVATRWGDIQARQEASGRPIPIADGMIAATAELYGMNVATGNPKDFESCGLEVVNPFDPRQ